MQKKVYFAGSITGVRTNAGIFKDIIEMIQALDKNVLTEHFKFPNPNTFLAKFINKELGDLLPEDIEKQDTAWIDESDYVVAEISAASTGTGREVEYARSKHLYGHPKAEVLCLYEEGSRASAMITGMTPDRYPNVTVRSYKNLDDINKTLKEFFKQ